jgi:hypothetical protein
MARLRIRRTLKWIGMSACGAILAVWTVSIVGHAAYKTPHWTYDSGQGAFTVVHHTWSGDAESVAAWEQQQAVAAGVHWNPNMSRIATAWERIGFFLPRFGGFPVYKLRNPPGASGVLHLQVHDGAAVLPYWLLLLPIALPTAVLWWRDRRRFPAGHCAKCGYNLTGNVSGRCPECGSLA